MTAPGTFETCLPALTCQFIKLMRTMRLGAQVVKINADLLHFQPAPSASESSIGGVDLIGAKVAAQASVRNAIMSKDLFIAVLPFPVCQRCVFPTWRLLNQHCYRALVSACLRGQGKWLRPTEQIVSWPPGQRNLFTRSRPQSGMLTGEIWAARTMSPIGNRRFFLIDLKNNRTSAHYAAHGKSNGNNLRATKFRGFRSDHDMVPLGPLRTAAADAPITSQYRTIADKYAGQVWNGLNSARLEGVASYNSYINSVPGVVWVIHPNWYVSAGYRKNNPGMLGRSLGCITLDPDVNNAIVNRLGNGALIYVTVGNDPVERYL